MDGTFTRGKKTCKASVYVPYDDCSNAICIAFYQMRLCRNCVADRPRYSAVTGLKTRGSSDSSTAASCGHKKALAIHELSSPGRAAIDLHEPTAQPRRRRACWQRHSGGAEAEVRVGGERGHGHRGAAQPDARGLNVPARSCAPPPSPPAPGSARCTPAP